MTLIETFSSKELRRWKVIQDKNIQHEIFTLEYWENKELSNRQLLDNMRYFLYFQEYFDYKIRRPDNWNKENLVNRCKELQQYIIKYLPRNKKDIIGFSDNRIKLDFWIYRGWSKDEAREKVSNVQKLNNHHFISKLKDNPEHYITRSQGNINYWMSRGFDEIEAKALVKDRQTTFTLAKCIAKYGEEVGIERWEQRQKLWQETLNSKSEEDKLTINKSKGKTFKQLVERHGEEKALAIKKAQGTGNIGISKQSIDCFDKITGYLIANYSFVRDDFQYGINKEHKYDEFMLYDKKHKTRFFYDFYCAKLNLIIEFHGTAFHANPNWTYNKIQNWSHPFEKEMIFIDSLGRDFRKRNFAISQGFNVIEIYSDEMDFDLLIEKILKFKQD